MQLIRWLPSVISMASFQGAGAGLPLFPPPPGNSTLPFSSSSSAAALPRGRSTSTIGSCTNCRRGHKRCGTERPCKTCIDSGRADSCADGMTAYQASGSGRRRGSSTAAAGRLPAAVSTSMDLDWSTPLGSTSFSQQLPSLSYSTSSSSSLSALSNSSFGSLDFSLGPLALPASSSLSSFSSGLPALPSALSTSTAAKQSVYFVLGTDMKIGRVSVCSILQATRCETDDMDRCAGAEPESARLSRSRDGHPEFRLLSASKR